MPAMSGIDDFFALGSGRAPINSDLWDGWFVRSGIHKVVLEVRDVGELSVPSGRVAVGNAHDLGAVAVGPSSDRPGIGLLPVFGPVPPGKYPVRLTGFRSNGGSFSEAYMSLVLSDIPAVTVEPWVAEGADFDGFGEDASSAVRNGVRVTSSATFMDAHAAAAYTPANGRAHLELLVSMQTRRSADGLQCGTIALLRESDGDTLAYSKGIEGTFPIMATRDANGALTGLHLDFGVVISGTSHEWWCRSGLPPSLAPMKSGAEHAPELNIAPTAEYFYALQTGAAPKLGNRWERMVGGVREATLSVEDLGLLTVPSGYVAACDPGYIGAHRVSFVADEHGRTGLIPVFGPIPAGQYPVRATVFTTPLDFDGGTAFLSLVISDKSTMSVEPAVPCAVEPVAGQKAGNVIGVDTGCACFVDAHAASRCQTADEIDLADLEDNPNYVLPLPTGENFISGRSGDGDGGYPVMATKDVDGNLTGLHIDFGLIGSVTGDEWVAARTTFVAGGGSGKK